MNTYIDGVQIADSLCSELEGYMGTQELLYELLAAMPCDEQIDYLVFVARHLDSFELNDLTLQYMNQHGIEG